MLENILMEAGILSKDQVQVAIKEQTKSQQPLDQILIDMGFISERVLCDFKASAGGIESIDLKKTVVDPVLVKQFPRADALKYKILPISQQENVIELAMANPLDVLALDKLRHHFGLNIAIKKRACSHAQLIEAIDLYYTQESTLTDLIREIEQGERTTALEDHLQSPNVRLINMFLWEAVQRNASDIHFEPEHRFVRVRYRIDGLLHQEITLHKDYWSALVIRLKVISGMDIAESRSPQNGRLTLHLSGRDVDFRLSIHPTIYGESVVVRILDRSYSLKKLGDLGFNQADVKSILRGIAQPHGLIIVTGPTGSGKTTTLYSLLQNIRDEALNIMTLEQPVEYKLRGIRQTEIQENSELGFAEGIRSILRHDPDIILVGEVRDSDTARMAIRASITGHQVYTTLHTQDAFGVVPRLYDLGVSREMLEGHLSLLIAQRLVRALCIHCKQEKAPSAQAKKAFSQNHLPCPPLISEAIGCTKCRETGHAGRFVVGEIVNFSDMQLDAARELTYAAIKKHAIAQGVETLFKKALRHVATGAISLEQALQLKVQEV